jgi:hypothetical protein
MPAYEMMDDAQLAAVLGYLRGFCTEPGWVRSELSFPRWMLGDKAFPENDVVATPAITLGGVPRFEGAVDVRPWRRTAMEIEFAAEAEPRVTLAVKHAFYGNVDRRAIASASLAMDFGPPPFAGVAHLLTGVQIGLITIQADVGGRVPIGPAPAWSAFAAAALHGPVWRPYASALAPGVAVRATVARGSPATIELAPLLYWRYSEQFSAGLGAVWPLTGGAWTVTGFVAYEYLYPF